jgi:hypothetical protein
MTFEEWSKEYTSDENFNSLNDHLMAKLLLMSCWDHQQKEIDRLCKVLEFYAEKDNWMWRHGAPDSEPIVFGDYGKNAKKALSDTKDR